MTKEEYFGDWAQAIDMDGVDKMLHRIRRQAKGQVVCPAYSDIFRAFHLCPFRSVRVVVLGQDPYPTLLNGKPMATGIAFGNPKHTPEESLSPSLGILRDSVMGLYHPWERITFDVSLEKWEKQGVLMLNTALTCPVGKPGGHVFQWQPFTDRLLVNMGKHSTGLVYILLGAQAKSYEGRIDRKFNHVLYDHHPAWYLRQGKDMPPDIWRKANDILVSQNGYGIDWCERSND